MQHSILIHFGMAVTFFSLCRKSGHFEHIKDSSVAFFQKGPINHLESRRMVMFH